MINLNKGQLKNEIYKLSRYQVANGNPILKLLYPTVETVELDSVISILDNVEKPIIPQFVADWIEESHSFGSSLNHDIFNLITDAYDTDADERKLIENYLYDSSDAIETIVDAYRYGFTVEKEQKYYAKVKGWGVNGNDGHVYYSGKFPLSLALSIESVAHTKDEWKNYGVYDGNADFVRVEELEE